MSTLTDEQRMLVDSVLRWGTDGCAPAQRQAVSAHVFGCPPERWRALGEMGWLALPLPEAQGGLGGSLSDVAILAEAFGRILLVEPFVASAVFGAGLLAELPESALREAWLPALASGERRIAFAAWEDGFEGRPGLPATRARVADEGWLLDGEKTLAPGAGGADGVLLVARLPDDASGDVRLGVFLVAAGAPGLALRNERLYDGRHAAALRLAGVPAECLWHGPADAVLACVASAFDRALVAHAAETLGTAAAAFELTRDYLITRRQFGRALSDNQAIRHRLVDLHVAIEETRALCLATAADPTSRRVAALGVCCTELARHVWEEAIQLHGAIGMTEEYQLGEQVRRLALAADLYGDASHHLGRLADLGLGETGRTP